MPSTNDTYLLKQIHQRNSVAEKNYGVGVSETIIIVKHATLELRQACFVGLGAARASINLINERRWGRSAELDDENMRELREAITMLSTALSEFKETKRKLLVDPYVSLIRNAKTRREQETLPLRTLYLAFVFASALMVVAKSILDIMEFIRDKADKRRKNRLWAPKGLRLFWRLLLTRESKEREGFGEDVSPEPDFEKWGDNCGGSTSFCLHVSSR
jgi:hypothetical protein